MASGHEVPLIHYRRQDSEAVQETTFTEVSSLHSTLMDVVPPPEDTRIRTRFLTYVRQRYLNIFFILLSLIVFLLALIAVLIYVQLTPSAITERAPEQPEANVSSVQRTTMQNITTRSISETSSIDPWLMRKPCQRVKCHNDSCKPKSLDYISMRGYTCCDCYDSHYTFRRFEYDYLRDKVSLVFQVPETITSVSKRDLINMKPLPNLNGMWNKQQESDTAWYYVYDGVSIPEEPED